MMSALNSIANQPINTNNSSSSSSNYGFGAAYGNCGSGSKRKIRRNNRKDQIYSPSHVVTGLTRFNNENNNDLENGANINNEAAVSSSRTIAETSLGSLNKK